MLRRAKDKRRTRLPTNHPSQNQERPSLKTAAEPRSVPSCNNGTSKTTTPHPKTARPRHVTRHVLQVSAYLIRQIKVQEGDAPVCGDVNTHTHTRRLEKQKHKRHNSRAAGSLRVRRTWSVVTVDSKCISSSIFDFKQRTLYLQETYKDLLVSQTVYIYALNAASIGQQNLC